MKHLLWLVCVLLVVSTVSAQETSVPSAPAQPASAPESSLAPLVIEVRAQRITRSALSEALLKELRQGGKQGEERPGGALELSDAASDTVRLTYKDALGRVTTRDLYLPADDPEALEKITIAAANLVRDQTGALSSLEAQQRAEEEAALAALQNAPKPAEPKPEPPKAPTAPKEVYDPCHPPLTIPFGVDLAWMLGTSSTPVGRQSARRLSLGFLGTYSAGVHGFQVSILANVDRRGSCGVEMSTALNLNLGDARGLQLSTINATIGDVRGAQLGITNFTRKGIHGAQLGVTNISLGPAAFQLGVTNLANIVDGDTRAQLGVLNFSRKSSHLQLGVWNTVWGPARVQLGVLNVAKDESKFQLGVVNYAGSARAPVGVISVVKNGRTSVDAWANENGALYGMLAHGGDCIYNMYGVGTRIQGSGGNRLTFAYGITARLYEHPRAALELQALNELYPRLAPFRMRSQVGRVRLAVDIKITDSIHIVPAVGYAVMISELPTQSEPVQAWFGESEFKPATVARDGKRRVGVYGFPSFAIGLRVPLTTPKKQ